MSPLLAEPTAREARRNEDSHVAQLEYERDRNRRQIALLEERQERMERELDAIRARRDKRGRAADARDGIRALGEEPAPQGPIRRRSKDAAVDEGRLRDAILRFKAFTLPEIAASLKVKPGTLRPQVNALVEKGALADTGEKFHGQVVYEHVRPEDPGDAFKVQQSAQPPLAPEQLAARGTVEGIGSNLLPGLPKEMRRVAREAMRDGWELRRTGSDHFELSRPGFKPVTLPGTPQNESEAARHVRFDLRRARRDGKPQGRGAPVPHTGRAMGPSGKPGQDKKNAERGFRVKRERQGT